VTYNSVTNPSIVTAGKRKSRKYSIKAFTIKLPRPRVRIITGISISLTIGRKKRLIKVSAPATRAKFLKSSGTVMPEIKIVAK